MQVLPVSKARLLMTGLFILHNCQLASPHTLFTTKTSSKVLFFAESVLIVDALTWSTIGSTCYQRNVTELTLREEQPARCRSSRRPKVRSINKRLQSDG